MAKELHCLWLLTLENYWSFWKMHPLLCLAGRNLVLLIFLAFIWKSINYSSVLNVLCPYMLWSVRRVPCLDKLFLQVECLERKCLICSLSFGDKALISEEISLEEKVNAVKKFLRKSGEIVKVIGNYEVLYV